VFLIKILVQQLCILLRSKGTEKDKNDEIIEEISKIGGLIEKLIKDYDTQKEYITYYDDLDDIEIDSEAEKIKRITNLRKQNIILPKIEKEFGYIADLDKFNI